MISFSELDAALLDLADRARRLRALSRVNPHQFLEDKQELARAIDELRTRAKTRSAMPLRALSDFRDGTVTSPAGRPIVVERRRKVA